MASLLQSRDNTCSTFNIIASPYGGCTMKDQEITSIAYCCEYGITATGCSCGWIYLWKVEEDNKNPQKLSPYVACVSQGGSEFSVIQCYFVPWKRSFLVGLCIPMVLISHHANGLLKYWSIEDGRFLLVLCTTAFLGSPAIDSQLIENTTFLLLTTHWGLIVLDLCRQCPCIVFYFGNGLCENKNNLNVIRKVERMSVLRFFTSFHLLKKQKEKFNCLQSKEDLNTENITNSFSYDWLSTMKKDSFVSQSPIQDIATNNERIKCKHISSNISLHTFVSARLENLTFYIWDITVTLKNWKNYINLIEKKDGIHKNRNCNFFLFPHLMTVFPLQILKLGIKPEKYLNPFSFKSNLPKDHIFQYPVNSSLSCSRLALDETCIAFCSHNGTWINVYKRTYDTLKVLNDVWSEKSYSYINEENQDIIYDSNECRVQLFVPKTYCKSLFHYDTSFIRNMNDSNNKWVGLHIITEATMDLWESFIQCDTLPTFKEHNIGLLCTLLIGYTSDGRIFIYNLSMIFQSFYSGKNISISSYIHLLSIPYMKNKTNYFNPTQLYSKIFFERMNTKQCSFACYVVTISNILPDGITIFHYHYDSHQSNKWYFCSCYESLSINGILDQNNIFSLPIALITNPKPYLIYYKILKKKEDIPIPSLVSVFKNDTIYLPLHNSKYKDSTIIIKNDILSRISEKINNRKNISLRQAAQKPFEITISTLNETSIKNTEMETIKQINDQQKNEKRLICFLSFSNTLLISGSYQGDIIFWSLPTLKLTLFSIHMSAVVMLMPLKILCMGTTETQLHPKFFCSIDISNTILLIEAYEKNSKHLMTLTNNSLDESYFFDPFSKMFPTHFEMYDLFHTNHNDLFYTPLLSTSHTLYQNSMKSNILHDFNKNNNQQNINITLPHTYLNDQINLEFKSQVKVFRLRRYSTLIWKDIKEILLDSQHSIIFVKCVTKLFLFSSYSGAMITFIDLCHFISKLIYAACLNYPKDQNNMKNYSTLLCPFTTQLITCENTLKTIQSLWCQWFHLWKNLFNKSILFQSICESKINVSKNEHLLSKYILNNFFNFPQLWNQSYISQELKKPFFISSIPILPLSIHMSYDSYSKNTFWPSSFGVYQIPVISLSLKEWITYPINLPQINCHNNIKETFQNVFYHENMTQEQFCTLEIFLCKFLLQQIPTWIFDSVINKLSKYEAHFLYQLRSKVCDSLWILGLGNPSSSFSWIFPKEKINQGFTNDIFKSRIPLIMKDDCFILKKTFDHINKEIFTRKIDTMSHILLFFERNRSIDLQHKIYENIDEKYILQDLKTIKESKLIKENIETTRRIRSKSVPKNALRIFSYENLNLCEFQQVSWNTTKNNEKLKRIWIHKKNENNIKYFTTPYHVIISSYVLFIYCCIFHSIFIRLEKYHPSLWISLNCKTPFHLTEKYQFEILVEVFLNTIVFKNNYSSILALWSYFMLSNITCTELFCLCWKWSSSLCRLLNDKEWKDYLNFSADLLRHHICACPKSAPADICMEYIMSHHHVMLCHTILFNSSSIEISFFNHNQLTIQSTQTIVQWSALLLFLFSYENPHVFISIRFHYGNHYEPLALLLLHYLFQTVEIITIRTPIYGMWCLEMFRLTYPLFYRYIIKNNSYSNDVLKNIERQFHTTQLFNMKDLKDSERWNIFQTEAYKELQMSLRSEESLLIPYHNLVLAFYSLSLNPYLKQHAFHNLLCLSLYDPLLFIKTFQYAMRRLDIGTLFCHTGLLLLTHFFLKYPTLAIHYLTHILEVSIYCLDPAHPFLRRHSLELSTNLLCQLVHTFPMAVFHQATQRVAVGTYTGFIVIYDLRTTSKSYVVKAGSDPIDVVAFTKDGNQFASYNKTTQVFCLWQCSSTGFLAGVIRQTNDCIKFLKLPRLNDHSLLDTFHDRKRIELTFRDQHHWLLKREDGKTYVICV